MTHDLPPSPLLDEYLAELVRAAAAELPIDRRTELLADIRSHIAAARAEAQANSPQDYQDDVEVAKILSQLGDPAAIVAAAFEELPDAQPLSQPQQSGRGFLEPFAIALVSIFGIFFWAVPIIPWLGWLTGVVLICVSRRWSFRQKMIAVFGVAFPTAIFSFLIFGATSVSVCTSPTPEVVAAPAHPGSAPKVIASGGSGPECTSAGGVPIALVIPLVILLLSAPVISLRQLTVRAIRPDGAQPRHTW